MEPKPKERIVFDEDLYYGDEGEEMAINDLMERDGLTEGEVREDFTDDEIFNHQMEMKDFDYEEEMRALAAFFNGEKSDMSDFVNPYGGNHILVSGLEDDSIAVSLDTMLKNGNQFSLDGGIPAWTVKGDDLAKVNDFLKKSCMEFCGSLPGDDKGEDGYSLTGEAKDATASRNGLSRNQMGIEEKADECKEAATALANGNAL